MSRHFEDHHEEEKRPFPHFDNEQDFAPHIELNIVVNQDIPLIAPPQYTPIYGEIFPVNSYGPHAYYQYAKFYPQFDSNAKLVLCSISKGAPVTNDEQNNIRQQQINQVNAQNRRLHWNYIRKLQGFICLNICFLIVLMIAINSNFSDYRKYQSSCPNYSKTNLFFAALGIVWIVLSIAGVYGASKRSLPILKYYTGGLYGILIITVIITAFGLLVGDNSPNCNGSFSKAVPIVGTALFTLFIVSLFSYISIKLRRIIIATPASQSSQPRQAGQPAGPASSQSRVEMQALNQRQQGRASARNR